MWWHFPGTTKHISLYNSVLDGEGHLLCDAFQAPADSIFFWNLDDLVCLTDDSFYEPPSRLPIVTQSLIVGVSYQEKLSRCCQANSLFCLSQWLWELLSASIILGKSCLPSDDFQAPPSRYPFVPHTTKVGFIYLVMLSMHRKANFPLCLNPWWRQSLTWPGFLGIIL